MNPLQEYARRRVAELKTNPHQHLIGDIPPAEIELLADSLYNEGQLHPIDILPDNTILDGHQRCQAAKLLDWDEVSVRIRHDLSSMSEEDMKAFIIESSLTRRQLGPIGIARAAQAYKEIEIERDYVHLRAREARIELRDRIATLVGSVSGRQLDRYMKLLELPRTLQDAVERKEITMNKGLELLKLPGYQLEEIHTQIESGKPIKEVLPKKTRSCVKRPPQQIYREFMTYLNRNIQLLENNTPDIAGTTLSPEESLALLDRTQRLIVRLEHIESKAQ